jgi:hypothetical protein
MNCSVQGIILNILLYIVPALPEPLVCHCFQSIANLHIELSAAASCPYPYSSRPPSIKECGNKPYSILPRRRKKRISYKVPHSIPLRHSCQCCTPTFQLSCRRQGQKTVAHEMSWLEERFIHVLTSAQLCLLNMESEDKYFLNRFKLFLTNLPITKKLKHLVFLKTEARSIAITSKKHYGNTSNTSESLETI